MSLELALTWKDVEKAAIATNTCIRPGLTNHDKARQDWESFPGRVEYWLSPKLVGGFAAGTRMTYSRVMRLTSLWGVQPLWLLDWCSPFTIDHVRQVAEVMGGLLLVTRSGQIHTALEGTLAVFPFPEIAPLKDFNYVARSFHEQEWMLVQCQNKAGVTGRVAQEATQPFED